MTVKDQGQVRVNDEERLRNRAMSLVAP